ncbi:hypothetical protein Hanom_Chr13g01201921 [Helianthus anomalus]
MSLFAARTTNQHHPVLCGCRRSLLFAGKDQQEGERVLSAGNTADSRRLTSSSRRRPIASRERASGQLVL